MSVLSEKIAALRKNAGETQTDLAEALGLSNRTVSKWENGESEPDTAMLIALADRYSVSVDELLGHTPPSSANPYENLTREETAQAYFRKIVDDTRTMTMEYMNKFRCGNDDCSDPQIPPKLYRGRQSGVSDNAIFTNIVHAPDTNFLVALMANEDNYAWLDTDADALAKFFTLLGKPNMMKLMLALHTPDALETFTADYAAGMNGCSSEDVTALLDLLSESLPCTGYDDAELEEGNRRIYTYAGSGLLLAMLNIAHEILHKEWRGDCIFQAGYKPVRPAVTRTGKEENR